MPLKKAKLSKWCEGSAGFCKTAKGNCDECTSGYKDLALRRKRNGEKIVRPRRKTRGLMKILEKKDALRKKVPFEDKRKFVRGFLRMLWKMAII